jgi:hypothetical protein
MFPSTFKTNLWPGRCTNSIGKHLEIFTLYSSNTLIISLITGNVSLIFFFLVEWFKIMVYYILIIFVVMGIKSGTLNMIGECSITKLQPQPILLL